MRGATAAVGLVGILMVAPLWAGERHSRSPGPMPEKVLTALMKGNERFAAGHPTHPHTERRRVQETGTRGQHPQAVVLTCSDSRVSPELLFDQGIGDLFTIRVAGNVANEDEAASVEYAAEHLAVPVCVVLGHTGCGAVSAVAHGEPLPRTFDHLLSPVRAAVAELHRTRPALHGEALVGEAIRANVWRAAADLLRGNAVLRERARRGKLVVVGALYDTRTGTVRWLGHHANERALLTGTVRAPHDSRTRR